MSPITIDKTVKQHRDNVAKLEKERLAIAQQIKDADAKLVVLPPAADLQKDLDAAEKKLQDAKDALLKAQAAVQAAQKAYKQSDDQLQELRATHATLRTLVQLTDPDGGVVSAATVKKTISGPITEFLKELREKVAEQEKEIPQQEAALNKLGEAVTAAVDQENTKRDGVNAAQQARDFAKNAFDQRAVLENTKAAHVVAENAKKTDVENAAKGLDAAKLERNVMFERVPASRPDYLKISIGTAVVEPAARDVLQELEQSEVAFMPHKHLTQIKQKVDQYGIVGNLLAITDLVNRGKDKPLKRRILASSYAYTLLALIEKVEAETGGDAEDVREAFGDRTNFANRIRHFQQDGLPGKTAPQALFAERFLEAIATKNQRPLPGAGTQRRADLIAGLLANLS
jgi:hypothetical protein